MSATLKLDRLARMELHLGRIEGRLEALLHLLADDGEDGPPVTDLDGKSTATPTADGTSLD
jgi:hypothetical protein